MDSIPGSCISGSFCHYGHSENGLQRWNEMQWFVFAPLVQKQDVRLTKEQESRLPTHWLKSKGAHKTMADALWRIRDLMLQDTLNIRQAYNL